MKKALFRIVSVILVLTMVAGISATSASAAQSFWKRSGSGALAAVVNTLLTGFNAVFPDSKAFTQKEDYKLENFYAGTDNFINEPAKDAAWKLGYSNISLVPEDYKEHTYYIGGFIGANNGFVNKVESVIDDMKARVIAIEDGSGRGVSVFATVDCIGMTNNDIKEIRKALVKKAGSKYNFASVNVFSTHAHSCIDTEGLWTNLFPKILKNIPLALTHIGTPEQGTDPHYMSFLYEQVATAMLNACDSMEAGTMTLSKKDIGSAYFNNKNRSSASALMTDMTRIKFTPFRDGGTSTMIVNIAAHPDVAGLPTADNSGRDVCGEYIYYMGETLADYGYNCMFFNGAIAGIYMARGATNDNLDLEKRYMQSERYGREIGKIALALNMTEDEIKADPKLYDQKVIDKEMQEGGENYTLWCKDWKPVKEEEVEPFFNIMLKTVYVPVTNPFIQLAGKLNLANYNVLVSGFKKYEICVEIGYMEFGNQLKVVMMPGEICQDLIVGGSSLTADGSYSGKAFAYPCIREMFRDDDIICFGLANDAIGYVIPDNDYSMAIAFDHYQELISLGKNTASTIMEGFAQIEKEVNRPS